MRHGDDDPQGARATPPRQLGAIAETAAARCRIADGACAGVSRANAVARPARRSPCPATFAALLDRRLRARAGRLYHRHARFLDDRPGGRPRRADPAPRQRDADRGGGRAFRRAGARRRSSISAPGRARCCSPRWPNGPRRPGWASMRPKRRWSYARRNAARLGMADRGEFRAGDWAWGLDERFDLILCNPPYIGDGGGAAARGARA